MPSCGWRRNTLTLVFLSVVVNSNAALSISKATPPPSDVSALFVPTNEWQEVAPDVSVPRGLHIRLDMESGKRFAKLMSAAEVAGGDGASGSTAALVAVAEPPPATPRRKPLTITTEIPAFDGRPLGAAAAAPTVPTVPSGVASRNGHAQPATAGINRTRRIEEAAARETAMKAKILRGLPQPEPELASALKRNLPQAELDRIVKLLWDKRQGELRAARDAMVTHVSVMQRELDLLRNASSSTPQRVAALLNLEWLVQDVDNAGDFAFIGGIEHVVFLLSPATGAEVRRHAAYVLGSAVKHVAKVQDAAVSFGALERLVAMLGEEGGRQRGGEEEDDDDDATGSKALAKTVYALGALVRGSAEAQRRFGAAAGGEALRRVAARVENGRRGAATKAAVLAGDLLSEHGVDAAMRKALATKAWCATLATRLRGAAGEDEREKIVDALAAAAEAAGCGGGVAVESAAAGECRAALADDAALHATLTELASAALASNDAADAEEREFAMDAVRKLDRLRDRLKLCGGEKRGQVQGEL